MASLMRSESLEIYPSHQAFALDFLAKYMKLCSKLIHWVPIPLLLSSVIVISIPQLASARTSSAPEPSEEPLDLGLLKPDTVPTRSDIITANTISQKGITTPSLWWAKEQFNEVSGKLINNWIAYQNQKRVDLVVNRQAWSLLDYLGRYRFVHKFGTVTRDNQYDLRIFNQQAERLATYTCNYNQTFPDCEIRIFDSFNQGTLTIPRQGLGGGD